MSAADDLLIDRFVATLNKRGFPSQLRTDVPEKLYRDIGVVNTEHADWCDWEIKGIKEAPWLSNVEAKLPSRLPPLFLSLLSRYIFLLFDAGPLTFFANTGEDIYDEFSLAVFRDEVLSEQMLAAGYLHFARLDTGSYDPICFDTNNPSGNGDYRIVQIDHEEILINDRVKVVKQIAPSFRQFVVDFLG